MRVALLIVSAVLALSGFADAMAAPPRVSVTLTIVGRGIVQIGNFGRVECHTTCRKTYRITRGRVLVLKAQTARNWKLIEWRGGCPHAAAQCSIRVLRPTKIAVTFLAPGRRGNPVPLGSEYEIDHQTGDYVGWRLTVVQTRFDPPDYFSVLVSATPISGSLELQKLISNIYVVAEGSSKLGRNGCGSSTPAPTLLSRGAIEGGSLVVPDGLAVTGYICFQIGSVEPASLALVTEPPLSTAFPPSAPDADARWFALR